MKLHYLIATLFLLVAVCVAQQEQEVSCAENDKPAGAPLTGWVGYTNTGTPIEGMTVQVFVDSRRSPVATTTTDSAGKFSFPTIGAGKYHVIATKKIPDAVIAADEVVTVQEDSRRIVCLAADGERDVISPEGVVIAYQLKEGATRPRGRMQRNSSGDYPEVIEVWMVRVESPSGTTEESKYILIEFAHVNIDELFVTDAELDSNLWRFKISSGGNCSRRGDRFVPTDFALGIDLPSPKGLPCYYMEERPVQVRSAGADTSR